LSRGRWIFAGAGLLLTAALLVPAAADWLVTRDGAKIETAGPWRVENRLVVFERPDGTYASMRLSEVDLEASERLTRELAEKARAPKAAPQSRPVVARLTEKELPPVAEAPVREEEAGGGDGAGGQGAAAPGAAAEDEARPPESLQVVSWREVSGPESAGLELVGDVRNVTDSTALDVVVTVVLRDEEGEEVETTQALLTTSALPPGGTAGFRASFPGIFHSAGVEFRTSGTLVLSAEPEEEATPQAPPPPNR
jgi:hypothetical protein